MCSKRAILLQEYIHIHVLDYVTDYCIEPLPHPVALLRLYEGSMKALLRLYEGSIKALLMRYFVCNQAQGVVADDHSMIYIFIYIFICI
jgi:hypothetical protein